ncbi:hybrid sensor histidine kinase/response regulator [Roseomonas elaeocarpi]|uniref:histidine kinase n=1 Tax=Roseomonas elaeocarpi TaxID=907779 RepID=A0ABV6JMB4_9PROT
MNTPPSPLPGNVYELLVQAVVDYAIYMLDPQGRVMSWNPGAERIKGYTASEIIGQHFSRFYTEEERAGGVPATALKIAAESGRFTAEAWRVRKDGSRFWALVVIDPIRQAGTLVGFAKITRDMTEQREAHLALLESEGRFRLLVQSVTDYAIFMLDPNGTVTNWNAGAERIKGYTASEIVGQHFSRFYTPEDIAEGVPFRALDTARRTGRFEAEGWRLRRDGSRFWASVVIDAIHDAGRLVGFAKITRDLTERRETQIQLEQSREQLFQSQKMEAVGHLTGGIAHDFNNLLTAITGSLDLLEAKFRQGRLEGADRFIDAAKEGARRAAALTQRLLAFSRRQALDPKPTDANRLIGSMEELIRRSVGPEIAVEVTLAAGLWTTLVDPPQLENALLNLCINARDAMPGGGRLRIETSNQRLNERAAREQDLAPGPYVVFRVSDTGTGMSPEVIAQAFDPFFTTKPIGKGTGLGLSMIYGFARQSGGQVRISSELGRGTVVCLYLPQHLGDAEAAEPAPVLLKAPRGPNGRTLLVVDDEPMVRMLIKEVLEEQGYAITEAEDGHSGLAILQSDARIDLVVSDLGLPGGMNGRQMADAARTIRPDLKVLFITGYADRAMIGERNLEQGMQVMTKPFSLDVLASRVAEMTNEATDH